MSDTTPSSPMSPISSAPEQAAAVIEVGLENFMVEVIEASRQQLVLLDFWAEWCGPCKELTPILEKLASESAGRVRLAKMNIDEHPEIAQQMQVQSIPAVFLFKGEKPVDAFLGAQPESAVREMIDKHLDAPLEDESAALLALAQSALEEGDLETASEVFFNLVEAEPQNEDARAGLAMAYMQSGKSDEAQKLLDDAGDSAHAGLAQIRAALALQEKSAGQDSAIAPLEAAIGKDENDHQARFDLALAYHGAGRAAEAMAALLEIITRAPQWNEEAARKQLLEFFNAYGVEDEAVIEARRRLSSLLFS